MDYCPLPFFAFFYENSLKKLSILYSGLSFQDISQVAEELAKQVFGVKKASTHFWGRGCSKEIGVFLVFPLN